MPLTIRDTSILPSLFKYTKSNAIYFGDEHELEYQKGHTVGAVSK